jgi:hypothetical protein
MTVGPDTEDAYEEAEVAVPVVSAGASDKAIEKHFETGRLRVVQERNDFFLPHVVDFIEGRRWGNLRPEYQRRLRWDDKKKSALIESFIMNVPVPPVFLYEKELGSYEVMDGQQRLSAIVDFMQGRFELTGLRIWPALNGRNYSQLPPMIKRGLERSKVSAITLMSESSKIDNVDLRAQVFERLNTGGERLNAQELRNSLYSGGFNSLIIELASSDKFASAWGIPSPSDHTLSDGSPDADLRENNYYKRMTDVEIVLRFFAFRNLEKLSGSVRAMLDRAMRDNRDPSGKELAALKSDFESALALCLDVFGDRVFRLPASALEATGALSRPLYDSQMIAMHILSDRAGEIRANSAKVCQAVLGLAEPESDTYELMVGRGNTALTIKERIELVVTKILEAVQNG